MRDREIEKLNIDLVIIGGGGAGLAAALSAAEKGTKNIVVLEKRGGFGGNTARATGLFACESPVQERQKIVADKDELFKRVMDWSHWSKINPRIVRAFLNKSGDTIRWLEKYGLEFTIVPFFPNQIPMVWHVPKGKGAQLTKVLAEKCREKGVLLFLRSSVEKLTLKPNGNLFKLLVAGNRELEIRTECVIITSGGFGGNKQLLKKYCPHYYDDMPLRGLPLAGDGIKLAVNAGATIEEFVTLLKEGPRIDLNLWPLSGLEREPITLWVNNKGKRFCDETIGIHPFESVNAMMQQPDKVSFTILDTTIKQKIEEKNAGLERALQSEITGGRVKKSSSWEDIAAWIGADPAIFKGTIDEYNAFCDHGYDQLFAKDRRYLWPLRKAPYYALRGLPHFLDTMGGIRINEHMQVLDKQDMPISGLYAAGVITSGWESDSYCSDLSGSAFGYAINSGRIAGENAAKFVKVSK